MPGLPYRGLPAGTTGMLQMEGGQPAYTPQRPSPGIDPAQGIKRKHDEARTQLGSDYKRDRAAMAQEYMTPVQWNNKLAKLNLKYQTQLDELGKATKGQLDYIQQIHQTAVNKQVAEEQALRAYLPPEAEKAAFPTVAAEPKPFTPTQVVSLAKNIQATAEKAIQEPWYKLGAEKTRKSLVDQYLATVEMLRVSDPRAFGPARQEQFNTIWNRVMSTDKNFANWFDKKGNPPLEMRMAIARGPGTRAIRKRATGTPIGISVAGSVKQAKQPITPNIAQQILQEAGGDKERARQIARQRGYRF